MARSSSIQPAVNLLIFVSAITIICAGLCGCGRQPKKPHILLITLDTTRRNHLSCYGYERKTSPNLDRLAEEGVRFENCVAMTSWTLPSHASLFTGLYSSTHGAHYDEKAELSLGQAVEGSKTSIEFLQDYRANGLGAGAITLAEILAEAGYVTGGVGSGPWLKPLFGLDQGFEFYDCDCDSSSGRSADAVNNLAIPFLRKRRAALKEGDEKPYFLFLNYFDPHFPYTPPSEFQYLFCDRELAQAAQNDKKSKNRYDISQYDAEILFMDRMIGSLFDELKRLELWDDTWIIVTSDHGEHFGEKGLSGHGSALYEETLGVPLIVKYPKGWDPAEDRTERVQLVNILPTILSRLEIDPIAPMDAPPIGQTGSVAVAELYKNLGKVKFEVEGDEERYDRNLKAIYIKDLKLIVSTRDNDPDAGLFDLGIDPGENNNLSKERPDLFRYMYRALSQWKESLGEPLRPLRIRGVDEATEEQLKGLGY